MFPRFGLLSARGSCIFCGDDHVFTGQRLGNDFRDGVYCEYYNASPAMTSPQRKRAYATMWRTQAHKVVVYHGEDFGELYDLRRGPDEFENRWEDPEYVDVRFEMMKRCFDARVFAMDPLSGRVSGF